MLGFIPWVHETTPKPPYGDDASPGVEGLDERVELRLCRNECQVLAICPLLEDGAAMGLGWGIAGWRKEGKGSLGRGVMSARFWPSGVEAAGKGLKH